MIFWSIKLNKNYALDIACLYKYRSFSDGVTFLSLDTDLSLYIGDHTPQFRINLIILNYIIFEISVYNMNHKDLQPI